MAVVILLNDKIILPSGIIVINPFNILLIGKEGGLNMLLKQLETGGKSEPLRKIKIFLNHYI
ncbi:hypothetical protein MSROBK_015870 [Spiroplasma poulsonii]|uniref:Uncharacterized protein n=1 Tax=Spiroplasma poulsonii TaxID=2138 RepID=A0A2P6FE28_9MOLU|nr:hypothetical protein [Spiroplasma poulsonii]KAF0850697.1 hypothetical protein MSROBK_015870 [Spiroplasma poulsonii]PQM31707.1 hypothetical protein SMSRO_SF015580 [Spiroplasma poulsonii]PWF96738.1 hypothetical protein SMSE_21850 [Spiroplasma poulsonii]PWF97313.1 hypothetical protein SMH99_21220 [Spiroplasma poulsonii]